MSNPTPIDPTPPVKFPPVWVMLEIFAMSALISIYPIINGYITGNVGLTALGVGFAITTGVISGLLSLRAYLIKGHIEIDPSGAILEVLTQLLTVTEAHHDKAAPGPVVINTGANPVTLSENVQSPIGTALSTAPMPMAQAAADAINGKATVARGDKGGGGQP